MQPPDDRKEWLSRGIASRQSDADEAAFLDGVVPPQEQIPPYRDAAPPIRNIAVVVGKRGPAPQRSASQRPLPQRPQPPRPAASKPQPSKSQPSKPQPPKSAPSRPAQQRPAPQKKPMLPRPAPRDPARPVPSRVPALPSRAAVTRTASTSLAVVKGAYGAVSNPHVLHDGGEHDGLKAYLVHSFEKQRRAGGWVLAVALIVGGGWATLMPLSGAVVIPGTVVTSSSVKKIQHQTGGVIAGIAVTEGMRVREGDILVRLDDVQVRATYEQVESRIGQLKQEISGMEAQIKSKTAQGDLIVKELDGVQQLWDKKLVPLNRLTGLQREAAQIDGEKAQLVSNIAETRSKINEAEVQLVAAKDRLSHIDLRAPVNGIVHQLAVHTVGGVINPAEVVMVIVPEGDELQIDAHLPPEEIDQVRKGQVAHVRFPAFNQRTTPEISGVVTYVSADITRDPQQSSSSPGYYSVRVSLPGEELSRLGDQLVAGMPAELFLQTNSRTMMSYMFKPITEQLGRMFRER